MSGAKCLGHGLWHERFGFYHFGAHLLGFGTHLLFHCHSCGSAHLGFRLGDALVCLGLFGLQFSADVVADIHISDVDGQDLECRIAVETLGEHRL